MKQLIEKLPFIKKKKQGPFAPQIKKVKKQIKSLKIKLFLLYTLPVCIVTLAQAVIKEYTKIKVRQAAMSAPTPVDPISVSADSTPVSTDSAK